MCPRVPRSHRAQLKVVMDTFVAPMGKVTDVDEWTVRDPST